MRLLNRHHFKASMCSTVLHIVTIVFLIGPSLQSTTEKIEAVGEEVQAEVTELKQDLEHAESKDPQKLEIYKQIRRLNPDGSYTVGYESDNGSFKIESRDVQGNVKGTYGYVDANGEIKRVSYIASNSTGNKKQNDEIQASTIVRPNRTQYVTSTTKRPYLSQSTTSSPNRQQSVIQTIPRKRLLGQYSLDKSSQSSTATTPIAQQSNSFYITSKYPEIAPATDATTTVIYATSVPTAKSTIIVHPTQISSISGRNLDQIIRPDRQESDSSRKVQIVNAREPPTSKPVVEEEESNENEKVSIRGNNYRRQFPNDKLYEREPEATTAAQQPQIVYSHVDDGEGSSVYGGSTSGKQLYTSTSTSRIPAIVIAARQRANQIQQAINNEQTTIPTTTRTPQKNYVKPQRIQDINKSSVEQSTESTSEQNFLTQTSRPIVPIPPNRGIQQPENDEPTIYRRRPIPPQNFQQYPIREHIRGVNPNVARNIGRAPPTNLDDRSEQFLRETNIPSSPDGLEQGGPQRFPDENLIIPPNLPPFRNQRKPYDERKFISQQEQDSEYDQQYFPNPGYNRFNSNYGNDILNRPLTTLDFERLLHYLVLRHQELQHQNARIGYYPQSNLYRSGAPVSNFGPYLPYQQIPRPPIIDPGFYDPRNPYYRPSNQVRQYNDPESAYQAQNQIPEQGGQYRRKPSNYYPTRYFTDTTGSYTKNDEQYDEAQPNNDESDLPSNIREELLYRMLMLAIRGEPPNQLIPNPSNKDLNPITVSGARGQYTKKPVRSVQILSED